MSDVAPLEDDSGPLLPPELVVDVEPFELEELDRYLAATAEGTEMSDTPVGAFVEAAEYSFERAEWAMAQLAVHQAEVDVLHARAHELHDRIDRWFKAESVKATGRKDFFDGALCTMLRRRNTEDPAVKSIALPSGLITSSGPKDPNATEIDFDGAAGKTEFIEWAQRYRRDLLTYEPKVLISALRALGPDDDGLLEREDGTVLASVLITDEEANEAYVDVQVPGMSSRRTERTFKAKPGK